MSVLQYLLAVDVGTSRTAASTARVKTDGGLVTAPFGLGRSSDSAPSAIFVADGELLFGEAAERRGIAQPERLVREFKRRIGDDVPIVVGDQRFAPEELYARMVAWVVDAVTQREGGRPSAICVTIPVTWGAHRSGLAAAALAREITSPVELITEPEAAARHYETTSPLIAGHAIAVYDLGGGTFDTVVLRKEDDGTVRLVGEPTGIADFGGADFDDIVLRHVLLAAGLSAATLSTDATARVALGSLRRECVEAKEALSFDSEAVVPVLVGQTNSTVRLTRAEFEEMVDDGVERTIDALGSALDAAGMTPADLDAILLTGGSSRIPRIAQLLSERFDRPIAIDADPKAIVALGAARELADRRAAAAGTAQDDLAVAAGLVLLGDAAASAADLDPGSASAPTHPAPDATRRRWSRRLPVTVAIAGGTMVLAGGIVLAGATALGNGGRPEAAKVALATDWLGFTFPDSSSPAEAAEAIQNPAAPSTPPTESAPSPKEPTRHTGRPSTGTTTPATRTSASTPSQGSAQPSTTAATQTSGGQAAGPAAADPPDSSPTDPPVDPTPTDPPVDPTPTDPPVDPTPTDPPVDPTPTEPPVDPTPTDPPVDPTPTDPPVDPAPSPPPPDPEPSVPAPEPEPAL